MAEKRSDGNFVSADIVKATAKEEKSTVKSVHKKKYNTRNKKKKNAQKRANEKNKKSRQERRAEELIIDEKSRELMKDGLQDVVSRTKRGGKKKRADETVSETKNADMQTPVSSAETTETDAHKTETDVVTEAVEEVTETEAFSDTEGDSGAAGIGDNLPVENGENADKTEVTDEDEGAESVSDTVFDEEASIDDAPTTVDGMSGEDIDDGDEVQYETESADATLYKEDDTPHIDPDGLDHYSMLDDDGDYADIQDINEKIDEFKALADSKNKKTAKPNEKERKIDNRFDFVELFVFTLCAVLLLTTFVFRHSIVEGSSMIDTLHDGDHLIISDLFYTPTYGDVVVVEDYTTGLRAPIVKRVIALAGDTVTVKNNYLENTVTVIVNGETVVENYVCIDGDLPPYANSQMKYVEDYVVPEGEIYVMGDHRNNSTDSRVFGAVNEQAVLGKVLLRFYPFDDFGTVD